MTKNFNTIISVETLNQLLTTADETRPLIIVDARFSLADADYGRRSYLEGHLPGAYFADLDKDLSRPARAGEGRHPLPDVDAFGALLGRFGVSAGTQVVVYDDVAGGVAGRFWWMLRHWVGHDGVAVLDGDFRGWQSARLPTTSDLPADQDCTAHAIADADAVVLIDDIVKISAGGGANQTIVDARTPERFRGDQEPIDPVAGHIPSSVNLSLSDNLDADGRFLTPAQLRQRFEAVAAAGPNHVIHSCGSGVSACHNLLAMDIAGLTGSRLYTGSWSEWIRDPQRPIGTGDSDG